MNRWIAFLLTLLAVFAAGMPAQASEEGLTEETAEIVTFPDDQAEDLAAGYIHQELYKTKKAGPLRGTQWTGDSLTGLDRTLYDDLKQRIIRVAAGELGSTEFKFYVDTLDIPLSFTAEDLHVEALSLNGALTNEAETAAKAAVKSFHAASIVYSLLADCPYELYWYNKTAGGGCRIATALRCTLSEDEQTVTVSGYIKFSMAVAEEYAAGVYLVDTSYGEAVQAAVENARGIVEENEGYSDYERLLAYKNAICDLTAYNFDAAGNGAAPYGNPWQIIWVFDGNEETKVVCEGYAKAFQYLNDLSSSSVTVISAQGTMNGVFHMWNIVTMENNRKYLADITNCDNGMLGYPDRLFLVGCASGSVDTGYTTKIGLTYIYNTRVFSLDELTISPWDYLEAWPETPVCSFSASKGYVGCCLAVRLNEDADGIVLQENGEEFACIGRDVLIPLNETGEHHFTIAAVRDGLQSEYSEPFTLEVVEPEGTVLNVPEAALTIEEEAFRGISASIVRLPESVSQIGDYAFADNENLILADIGNACYNSNAFENCPNAVLCIEDAAKGFQEGVEFLIMQNERGTDTVVLDEPQ